VSVVRIDTMQCRKYVSTTMDIRLNFEVRLVKRTLASVRDTRVRDQHML
jgi:hypothetical protein